MVVVVYSAAARFLQTETQQTMKDGLLTPIYSRDGKTVLLSVDPNLDVSVIQEVIATKIAKRGQAVEVYRWQPPTWYKCGANDGKLSNPHQVGQFRAIVVEASYCLDVHRKAGQIVRLLVGKETTDSIIQHYLRVAQLEHLKRLPPEAFCLKLVVKQKAVGVLHGNTSLRRSLVRLLKRDPGFVPTGIATSASIYFSLSRLGKERLASTRSLLLAAQPTQLGDCIVCRAVPRTGAFSPCGHLATCQHCGQVLDACPVCRQPVKFWLRIYHP